MEELRVEEALGEDLRVFPDLEREAVRELVLGRGLVLEGERVDRVFLDAAEILQKFLTELNPAEFGLSCVNILLRLLLTIFYCLLHQNVAHLLPVDHHHASLVVQAVSVDDRADLRRTEAQVHRHARRHARAQDRGRLLRPEMDCARSELLEEDLRELLPFTLRRVERLQNRHAAEHIRVVLALQGAELGLERVEIRDLAVLDDRTAVVLHIEQHVLRGLRRIARIRAERVQAVLRPLVHRLAHLQLVRPQVHHRRHVHARRRDRGYLGRHLRSGIKRNEFPALNPKIAHFTTVICSPFRSCCISCFIRLMLSCFAWSSFTMSLNILF